MFAFWIATSTGSTILSCSVVSTINNGRNVVKWNDLIDLIHLGKVWSRLDLLRRIEVEPLWRFVDGGSSSSACWPIGMLAQRRKQLVVPPWTYVVNNITLVVAATIASLFWDGNLWQCKKRKDEHPTNNQSTINNYPQQQQKILTPRDGSPQPSMPQHGLLSKRNTIFNPSAI